MLRSLDTLQTALNKSRFDILIFDELLNAIAGNFVCEERVIEFIKPFLPEKEIIVTGRGRPKKLLRLAQYATEFRLLKHPFQKGVLARKAIEY